MTTYKPISTSGSICFVLAIAPGQEPRCVVQYDQAEPGGWEKCTAMARHLEAWEAAGRPEVGGPARAS